MRILNLPFIITFIIIFLILIVNVSAYKIDSKVEEELKTKEKVPVIVILKDEAYQKDFYVLSEQSKNRLLEKEIHNRKLMVKKQQDRVLSKLRLETEEEDLLFNSEDYDFKLKNTFSVINGFSGEVTEEGLEKLKKNANVARIYYDNKKHVSLSASIPQINADKVWPLRPNGINLTGLWQTICVIDSGVDYTHLNLGNCSTANFTNGTCDKVIGGWDYQNSDNDPIDDHGHGTHVAGIIISNHTVYRGIAPDAKIVALKACDNGNPSSCSDSNIVSSIDWCIANKTKFNISVITMSLGGGCYNNICNGQDSVVDAANNATRFNIFVDASAGNNNAGQNCIASPACGSNVTAVGGVQDDDVTIEYNRASFISILAPSQTITSTVLRSGGVLSDSSGFRSVSGTSMAAPHIAGIAALMLQFNSSLTPLQIRNVINNTGKAINDSGTIYKRADALAAIHALDTIPPKWSNNATNNTAPKKNDVVQFNITFNDTIGLSFYFFSWNDTNVWVNITNGTLNTTSQQVILNQTITATRGKVVYWKFYFNDTNNNWNMTDEYIFTVENTIPTAINTTLNSTDSLNRTNGSLVAYFSYYDIDNDTNTLNETRWYNNSVYMPLLDNLTIVGSRNLSNNDVWVFSVRVFDGYNLSVWYNSSNITVRNNPPNILTLNFPSNNSVIRVNYTLLNWTAIDPDGNSMNCYIYGDNTTNPTSLVNITNNIVNGTASIYNWTNLNETVYYWKVQCDDGTSNSSNSSIYQFTIAIPPITYPSITSVADYDSDGNIEINWTDDGNETGETYRVYRSTSKISSISDSVTNLTSGIAEGIRFFEDNTTIHGTQYFYVLVTVDSNGYYNDSVISNSLNGTANDTIKPKTTTNLNIIASGDTATLRWHNTSKDINGNSDFYSLQYVIYYSTNFNSSASLANESLTNYNTKTVSINYTSIAVTSSETYHFIVTTLDDGGNKNLTLDYFNNYRNASLTYTSSSNDGGGGGSSGSGGGGGGIGGGGGGGGGGVSISPKINLDIKQGFADDSGYAAKQTQGDEAKFSMNNKEYIIKISKLSSDSVSIDVAGALSILKPEDSKEFDVDNDGSNDISIALKKIEGGRAEIIYKMLAKKEEAKEELQKEEVKEEESKKEIKKESKLKINKEYILFLVSALIFFIFASIMLYKYTKKRKII